MKSGETTRTVSFSTSLHYSSLADFKKAGDGIPMLAGQTHEGVDNGYGLQGNPTLHELQDAVAKLEGGKQALLFPSGLTALTALGTLLTSNDHWLLPDSVYAPLARYAEYLKEMFGVRYDFYDPNDLSTLERYITEQTKLIHIESPSSVTFEVTDIGAVVDIAKRYSILTSADNTWATGALCRPLDYGVDIAILSLTKYASGYGDVFMGALVTKDATIFKPFSYHHRVHGYTVSPVSALLVLRGLETLEVRLRAHSANARQLIESMRQSPCVTKLYYIDAEKERVFNGANGLFSVELDRVYTTAELDRAFSGLAVFSIGESWGGTRSLLLPFQPADLGNRISSPHGTIIRFHAGLEGAALQLADVKEFFTALPEALLTRR